MLVFMNPKDKSDKQFIDWKRKYYIDDVYTEDDAAHTWDRWLMRAQRCGRKTPKAKLKEWFPHTQYLKQLDIAGNEDRSSDVTWHQMTYVTSADKRPLIVRGSNYPITISEHAVRRYWQRIGSKPDIKSWCHTFPWFEVVDGKLNYIYQAIAIDEGLLLGEFNRIAMALDFFVLGTNQRFSEQRIGFRAKTFIDNSRLRANQLDIKEKLLESQTQVLC